MSRIIAKLQRKSEFPNWIIKDFPSSFLMIIDCKRNGQYDTDNSGNIGKLHRKPQVPKEHRVLDKDARNQNKVQVT